VPPANAERHVDRGKTLAHVPAGTAPAREILQKPILTGSLKCVRSRAQKNAGEQAKRKSVMRITIDEELRQVHVSQGHMLLTLQLARADTAVELEAAAEALRAALKKARVVVVNGEAMRL